MVTYEFLKSIENDPIFLTLLKKGVISLSVLDKMVYYERYLAEFKQTQNNWQSIINTAEYYNVSEMTVRRAIQKMS